MEAMEKFMVIGVGGLGGKLAESLAPFIQYCDKIPKEKKNLVLADGDHYEPHNDERQSFEKLGPKPQVKCEELAPRYTGVKFFPVNKWVVEQAPPSPPSGEGGEGDPGVIAASELIGNNDVVVCVVDNFACRAIVADAASRVDNIDLILAGNNEGYEGSFYHYQRRDGKDVTMNPLWKDELANPTDRNPGEMSCEERARIEGGTQSIWTNMAVGAAVGSKINKIITEEIRMPNTDEAYFDFDTFRASGRDRSAVDETAEEESPSESLVS